MSKSFAKEKEILPEYPRTLHLPFKPNASPDDKLATDEDAKIVFERHCVIQEKIDGSNCGMALVDGNAVIRNREFILCKGYKKDTPAKKQFASVFTWFYENRDKFEKLARIIPNTSVFGEWMVAQHGIYYDKLPSWFIAYDLYDYEQRQFVEPVEATEALKAVGFATVPTLYAGAVPNYELLEDLAKGPSPFTTTAPREGIYIKIPNETKLHNRFKMVRADFVRGALWSHEKLNKNKVVKG